MNPWTPLAAATIGWASSAVLTRAVLVRGVGALIVVPLRMTFAMAALLLVTAATGRFSTRSRRAWRRGVVLGVVGMSFPMLLMTLALEDLPVSIGGLLIALIPLATVGAAHFLVDGERFVLRSLPGLLLALAGSAVLVGFGGNTIEGVGNLWKGVFLTVAGVLSAGIGGALSRRFALEVPSDELVLPQFTVNWVVLLGLAPLLGAEQISGIDTVDWLLIAGIGVIGTTLPFASFLIGAAVNPASRLALTGYSVPVLAVVLAVIFLGESLTLEIIVGAVMIIGGVILAEKYGKHVPEPGVATAR
ncbi:MAG TPA: DMT family transporter [Acidimicrobiia bacterium]|nr:DMT family transporter [Acidimicrobiia bacterium]